MDLLLHISGEVFERQELLNGTQSATLRGRTEQGEALEAAVSWSRGLVELGAEGDITVTLRDGQLFGMLVHSEAELSPGGSLALDLRFEIDGGDGAYDAARGSIGASVVLEDDVFEGDWAVETA